MAQGGISKEKEFATGCLVWIIKARNNALNLDFLTFPKGNRDSDEESDQPCQIDLEEVRSLYREIYEAINTYAAKHKEAIEEKYRSIFTLHGDLADPHVKNFLAVVSLFAKDVQENPLCYKSIIEFCARVSVCAYMSYRDKGLQQAVIYAVSCIEWVLEKFHSDDSKYTELRSFAEDFSKKLQ